jgi:predicted lipoprotein with Yx(FWY)xxD motif
MRRTMRRTAICLLPALTASLALAACGGSSYSAGSSSKSNAAATSKSQSPAASSSASAGGAIKTAANSTLGATVLTDARGMTLYRLSGEQAGKFICTGAGCLQVWHPVTASAAGAPSGGVASLGTVKRPEGSEQVTYKGMPLYTFAGDRQTGDAKGQGLKDVGTWNAVTVGASATPATPAAPAAASESPPAESGGAYHY